MKLSDKQTAVLNWIREIFAGYPFDEDNELDLEITDMLKMIQEKHEKLGATSTSDSEIANGIKNLDAFTFRALVDKGSAEPDACIWWNPIETPYKSFEAANKAEHKLSCYQAPFEHPAPDIIYNVVMARLIRD
ncbi:MAG: hypothetical protein D6B27_04045 [Gammaproteobacteria bacterium]|nr:MAG: hypothetical protein D6B27_04045 [Gammaproteobacteria bacterium]